MTVYSDASGDYKTLDPDHLLAQGCEALNLALSDQQRAQCLYHIENMQRWNKTHNLTAVKNYQEMVVKHTLDALSIARYLSNSTQVLDIGTGGGLPGVPLAINFPDKNFTLLDSSQKKTSFVRSTITTLGLKNCQVVTARVESFSSNVLFDTVIARAVSDPACLMAWAQGILSPGGALICMLGQKVDELILTSQAFVCVTVDALQVPFLNAERHVALVKRR